MSKKFILLPACLSLALFFIFSACSDNDNSANSGNHSSSSPAPISSSSSSSSSVQCFSADNGIITDTRDNEPYGYVTICSQTWMTKNLNYNAPGSRCHGDNTGGDSENRCGIYGRLYDWSTAMGFSFSLSPDCNTTFCSGQTDQPHQGICPDGWHIPSNEDWDKLYHYVDGTGGTSSPYDSPTAGRYLKAADGWSGCGPSYSGKTYSCEDTYSFSALPGGYGHSRGSFGDVGKFGYWWSASEYGNRSDRAYYRFMDYSYDGAHWNGRVKSSFFSVRCIRE